MSEGGTVRHPDRIRPALRDGGKSDTRQMWRGLGEAWNVLSTIIAGVAIWGAVGYGIDRLAGTRPIFFVVGALVGNFAAIYLVYMKSLGASAGVSAPGTKEAPSDAS